MSVRLARISILGFEFKGMSMFANRTLVELHAPLQTVQYRAEHLFSRPLFLPNPVSSPDPFSSADECSMRTL